MTMFHELVKEDSNIHYFYIGKATILSYKGSQIQISQYISQTSPTIIKLCIYYVVNKECIDSMTFTQTRRCAQSW